MGCTTHSCSHQISTRLDDAAERGSVLVTHASTLMEVKTGRAKVKRQHPAGATMPVESIAAFGASLPVRSQVTRHRRRWRRRRPRVADTCRRQRHHRRLWLCNRLNLCLFHLHRSKKRYAARRSHFDQFKFARLVRFDRTRHNRQTIHGPQFPTCRFRRREYRSRFISLRTEHV